MSYHPVNCTVDLVSLMRCAIMFGVYRLVGLHPWTSLLSLEEWPFLQQADQCLFRSDWFNFIVSTRLAV